MNVRALKWYWIISLDSALYERFLLKND